MPTVVRNECRRMASVNGVGSAVKSNQIEVES